MAFSERRCAEVIHALGNSTSRAELKRSQSAPSERRATYMLQVVSGGVSKSRRA
jgi:hypothetical protein